MAAARGGRFLLAALRSSGAQPRLRPPAGEGGTGGVRGVGPRAVGGGRTCTARPGRPRLPEVAALGLVRPLEVRRVRVPQAAPRRFRLVPAVAE